MSYSEFLNKIRNKSVLFCGLGKSNMPFLEMLAKEGIKIIAHDKRNEGVFDKKYLKILKNYNNIDIRLNDDGIWTSNPDIVIRTPGLSFFDKNLIHLRNHGSVITSEMEIFFDLCPCKIIGVTGSDGKTTVTTIISEILKHNGMTVHIGGNIGEPLLPKIMEINKNDVAVVELSSFQLMSMRKSPDISVITNISPNHLDIHSSMEEYIYSKKQILLHQNAFSRTVLNFDNSETRNFESDVRGRKIFFSSKNKLSDGVWVDENKKIIYSANGIDAEVLDVEKIKIPGIHNLENYLAAIACTFDMVSKKSIIDVAQNFAGVEHRIEFVKEVRGVRFYNDSIASTPNRTVNGALSVFDGENITLIAGGYDKKIPFDILIEDIIKKVRVLILMGATSDKIYNQVINHPSYKTSGLKVFKADSMKDAVDTAYKNSHSKSVVLLSPACASFGMYNNFEERGKDFKKEVNLLKV